jgi:hypothetical protein
LILAWTDARTPPGLSGQQDIYARRITAIGDSMWLANGVALCSAAGAQHSPALASDGAGGAIVAWVDERNPIAPAIYARRVDALGIPLWGSNGILLGAASADEGAPQIVSDGAGGAIVVWVDSRTPPGGANLYAQRLHSSGALLWPSGGIALSGVAIAPSQLTAVSDGAAGALVAWTNHFFYDDSVFDLRIQRVTASGALPWTGDGVKLRSAAFDYTRPALATDGTGGAIACWSDRATRQGPWSLRAARVDGSGLLPWAQEAELSSDSPAPFAPVLVPSGLGTAIAGWFGDGPGGTGRDVYAQRIGPPGAFWVSGGVAVTSAPLDQEYLAAASDGLGGAVFVWSDPREETPGSHVWDILAQRVDLSGATMWAEDGVPVCDAPGPQDQPVVVPDGNAGALVAWRDARPTAIGSDVYAQNVRANGSLGVSAVAVGRDAGATGLWLAPGANPVRGGGVAFRFRLPAEGDARLALCDLAGRRVRVLASGWHSAGAHEARWDGRDAAGAIAPAGVYFARLEWGGQSVARRFALVK